jgi:hypothetical protein
MLFSSALVPHRRPTRRRERRGFCLNVFLHRHDGGSADTPRVAACGMGEFDLRGPLTGFDCMIQSSSMSAGRNACD